MEAPELHTQLMNDAKRYDPTAHTRGILTPYRDVILMQRSKYMSYEQIAATFRRHGLTVSPAAIGVFCRRTFTKAEIKRARLGQTTPKSTSVNPPTVAPAFGASASEADTSANSKRGPKIARDDY